MKQKFNDFATSSKGLKLCVILLGIIFNVCTFGIGYDSGRLDLMNEKEED